MSSTPGAPESARLDELAAVTAEYAKYSRHAFGFASASAGAYVLAVLAVRAYSFPSGNVLFAFAPILWILLLPRARARYQQHGVVLAPEPDMEGLAPDLLFPIFTFVAALLGLWLLAKFGLPWARTAGGPGYVGLVAAAAAYVTTPVIARRRVTGVTASTLTSVLAMLATTGWKPYASGAWTWGTAGLAAVFVIVGARQHRAFLRLERRLAGLKERA